ncbi:MATE family efflux transporter [Shewanella hanedai]|uniref:MATE family efflux transporter n=1 Tax=Shewanella hanedai TaxID=25 RepID=A0A553JSI1_SHEHA|nr:MATE family efflux transporter [Shewanella hanedai]TRY15418.1 MATE family efflux transporter [Shewanella hanedai]GGI79609.1 MATE family efflux transporter [Shewanella hanedai]
MNVTQSADNPLLHHSVKKRLLVNTLHILIGLLAVISFNLVDTWFISQLGVDALSAMGYLGPVVLILIAVLIGTEMTASIHVAESVALNDRRRTAHTILAGLSFSQVITLPISVIGFFAAPAIFNLLGANNQIALLGQDYLKIWFLGYPLLAFCMVGTGLLRGGGNAKSAGRLLLLATLINVVIDPLLIFGVAQWDGLGIVGAAWASFLARLVCSVFVVKILKDKYQLHEHQLEGLNRHIALWSEFIALTATVAFNRLLIPLSTAIATIMIAQFGDFAVAAFGLTNLLTTLPLAFVLAINAAVVPFIKQNLSLNQHERVVEGLRFVVWLVLGWGVVQAVFFWLIYPFIVISFTKDPLVADLLEFYFQWVPLTLTGTGLFLVNNAVCYSFKQNRDVLMLNLLRCVGFYLPCVYLGGQYGGSYGVFIGISLANIMMGLLALYRLKQVINTSKDPFPY